MSEKGLHRAVLHQAALYFGWENFKHYARINAKYANKLVNQVYHMTTEQKKEMLKALRNKPAHDEYDREQLNYLK